MSLTIQLNGSNYVSDKTRSAFENALKDGRTVQLAPVSHETAGGNGHGEGHGNSHHGAPVTPAVEAADESQAGIAAGTDYMLVMESLERGLAQSYEHQAHTLRVHEQYLSHQSDYANLVGQLLRQQGDIFTQGSTSPQLAELAVKVLESLSHSMARFHDLQSETLNVHKEFLSQQAQYSQAQMKLLQLSVAADQHSTTDPGPTDDSSKKHHASHGASHGNGDEHGNGHHSAPAQVRQPGSDESTAIKPPAAPISPPVLPVPSVVQPVPAVSKATPAAVDKPQPRILPPTPPPAPAPAASAAVTPEVLTQSLIAIVSDKTGYPADMLDLSMDMEADLGIDSIKRVEIMGALQEHHPNLPKVEPQSLAELRTLRQIVEHIQAAMGGATQPCVSQPTAPVQTAPAHPPAVAAATVLVDADTLRQSLLAVVSEKTGYPADMLDLSMDMEADLGIDSIKRVEIMGTLQEHHPNLPKVEPQALAELRTLTQIVEFLQAGPDAKKA